MKIRLSIECENDGELLDAIDAFGHVEVWTNRQVNYKHEFGAFDLLEKLTKMTELSKARGQREREERQAATALATAIDDG